MGLGILLASNFGVFVKLYFDHQKDKKIKAEKELKEKETTNTDAINKLTAAINQNTRALNHFESDLQRLFTAVKLVAGEKWPDISKIIQDEHPRAKKGFEEV